LPCPPDLLTDPGDRGDSCGFAQKMRVIGG